MLRSEWDGMTRKANSANTERKSGTVHTARYGVGRKETANEMEDDVFMFVTSFLSYTQTHIAIFQFSFIV